jgi:hypothetical protein
MSMGNMGRSRERRLVWMKGNQVVWGWRGSGVECRVSSVELVIIGGEGRSSRFGSGSSRLATGHVYWTMSPLYPGMLKIRSYHGPLSCLSSHSTGSRYLVVVFPRREVAKAANGHGSRHVHDDHVDARLAATGPRRVSSICDARGPGRVSGGVPEREWQQRYNGSDSAGQSNAHVLLRFRPRTQAPDDQNPSRPRPIGPPSLCRAIGPFAAVGLDTRSLQSTRPPLVAILIPRAHGRQQGRKAPPASAWMFCVAAAASGTDPEAALLTMLAAVCAKMSPPTCYSTRQPPSQVVRQPPTSNGN